jgi:CRISPR-associated endoribonuclease Cas6
MLLTASITLAPLHPAQRVPLLATGLHNFLQQLFATTDPEWAEELSRDQVPKPLSISGPLMSEESGLAVRLDPSRQYLLCLNALEARAAQALTTALAGRLQGTTIALDNHSFKVIEVQLKATAYSTLFSRYFPEEPAARQIEMFFQTPTSFRSGRKTVPLPLPELVFGSLLERWNLYAPYTLARDLKHFAKENVAISYYELKAWNLTLAGGKQPAFVGRCGFYILSHDPYWCRAINLLADFASYSGVGMKTAMGMGKVRRVYREGQLSSTEGRNTRDPI